MAVRTTSTDAAAAKARRRRESSSAVKVRKRAAPSEKDIASAVHTALESAPASVRTDFVEAVADREEAGLDDALWGAAPSTDEVRAAALQGLKSDFLARRELLDASLSRPQVAELLGVTPQAVLDRLAEGDLVGLRDGREWRIPMWQINAGAERGFLPGIAALREVFPGGLVALSRWVTTPNADLGGATPADALAAGRAPQVIAAAAAITAAAW